MTSTQQQNMTFAAPSLRRVLMLAAVWASVVMTALTGGCHRTPPLQINTPLYSPFDRPATWAVAPLNNETGVSTVDGLAAADIVARDVADIQGIDVLPVQRTLDAMRAMDIGRIDSPAQARQIARLVGADGIIVGTITTYDPYRPPKLGMILEYYAATTGSSPGTAEASRGAEESGAAAGGWINNIGLAANERQVGSAVNDGANGPDATAAGVFDAADNAVMLQVKSYALGMTQGDTALSWEKYLVVMDLYTRFVGHRLLGELIDQINGRYQEQLYQQQRRMERNAVGSTVLEPVFPMRQAHGGKGSGP